MTECSRWRIELTGCSRFIRTRVSDLLDTHGGARSRGWRHEVVAYVATLYWTVTLIGWYGSGSNRYGRHFLILKIIFLLFISV